MLTIRDLIEQTEVQGTVIVSQIKDGDVVDVFKSEEYGGLHECKKLEPYLDKEIKYIYPVIDLANASTLSVVKIEVE